MSIHPEVLAQADTAQAIAIDEGRRLFVKTWENAAGARFVSIAPQYRSRSGDWRLSHSGLILAPEVARQLAPALLAMAATIGGAPTDPMPTQADRELSRMP